METELIPNENAPENTLITPETPANDVVPEVKAAGVPGAEDGTEVPAYVPDFKYKVYNQEKELPEWARPLLNKDTEKHFKDLFSKADAFDPIKEKLKTTHGEFDTVKSSYETINKNIETLRGFVKVNDFDSFFQGLNIPKEMIFKWVQDKINYQDMTPEQRSEYDNAIALKRRNLELERNSNQVSQQYQQAVTQTRERDIQSELAKPEVNSLMQEFDRARGQVGAFRQEVIKRGIAHLSATGEDMTAEQAVQEVVGMLNAFRPAATPASATAAQPNANPVNAPVLPNVKGKSVSPTRKSPRSIADLKKLASQLSN
jgi:hypothetical protein